MKSKRILSIVLSLLLVLSILPMTAFADVSETESGTESVSFKMNVSIAEGTDTPDNYGVEYQVVDAAGDRVEGPGFGGSYNGSEQANVNLTGLKSGYKVKIKVRSAGLGIRLSGADVSEEGWDSGKILSLTELNDGNLAFELFQKASENPGDGGNPDPGEGGNPEPGEGGNQSTPGEFRFTCQDQMITGGSIWYKFNTMDEFVQVEENSQYASLALDEAVTSITIKFVPNGGYRLDTTRGVTLWVNGGNEFEAKGDNTADFVSDSGHTFPLAEMVGESDSVMNSSFELEFGFEDENGGPGPGPEEPGEPPHGGYEGKKVTAEVTITGEADFCINDTNWIHESKKVEYTYDVTKETVDFYVSWFINEKYTEFTINGEDYLKQLPTDKQALLNACKGQVYEVSIEVPYSEEYKISATKEWLSGDEMPVGNFLWTYNEEEKYRYDEEGNLETDENGNAVLNDDYIDHGRMELLSVEYEGKTYSPEQLNNPGSAFDWSESAEGGSAVLPAGAEVTVRLVPEYGYQLTSFEVNGGTFGTGDKQSTFIFEIKGGNFHLGARFTPVEDKVESNSKNINDGSIKLGENEIDTGSVVLSVEDATNYNEVGFESAIEDREGYQIASVFDINLNQIIYKGTEENVWLNSMNDLKEPAEISLQLDGYYQDAVVVHETHENTYEVIPTTYDSRTGTITFETNSFSNYAVAVDTPIVRKYLFVDFDPWGEGKEAHAQVMAKIGDEEDFPVETWQPYSYEGEETEILFTLTSPQERAKCEPIVHVEIFRDGGEEPEINEVELTKVQGQDGTYEFCISSDETCREMIVHIWWSEFDQLEPDEGEKMIHLNVPGGEEYGTIQLNQDAKRWISLDDETKYIFSADTEVIAEFVPAEGKLLSTVFIDFDYYSEKPIEDLPEENWHSLSELYQDGKYLYNVKEHQIYMEAIFEDCEHIEVTDKAVEATCTETGLTEGKHCSVCGKVLVAQKEVPAKGHQLVAKNREPTLDQDGYKTYYECKACQKIFSDAQGKNEIKDLPAWKTGEGKIPSLKTQFEVYKKNGQAKAEGKKQAGDSAEVIKLIDTAKSEIEKITYDTQKDLDGNKKKVDDILTQLASDLVDQKMTEAGCVPDKIEKPVAGNIVNITTEVKNNSLNASLSNIPSGSIPLTEEESSNGVYVWMELNTATSDSSTAEAFDGKLKGYSVGAYMEIDLFKMSTEGTVNAITDTNSEVSVTVTVPEGMLNNDKDIIRTFYIARNHNGVVEILGASYDANTKTLTFKTDKFSAYAIVYKDAQRNTNTEGNQMNVGYTAAKTGDSSNQLLWITLLLASAMSMFVVFMIRRKRTH